MGTNEPSHPIQGFILTRSSWDQGPRNRDQTAIELWAATNQGPALIRILGERPIFFVAQPEQVSHDETPETKNQSSSAYLSSIKSALHRFGQQIEIKPLDLKTFSHAPITGVYCRSIDVFFRAQDALERSGFEVLEGDIRLHERFLVERFIYGGIEIHGEGVSKNGYTEYQNCRVRPAEYRPPLLVTSLDIECDLSGELFSIGLSHQRVAPDGRRLESRHEVLMIGDGSDGHEVRTDDGESVALVWFAGEAELIAGLIESMNDMNPDLLIGWSLVNFDLRILVQRAEFHRIRFAIGRDRQVARWRSNATDKEKGFIFIPGRVAIDGIEALKSATYRFPSFSLEAVSRALLGKGKHVEQDVDDRFAEIKHNFHHQKRKLAAYNIQDCLLVSEVFEHTRILDYLILRGELTGLELDRAGGSVAAFTNLYLPRLHRAGYIAPSIPGEGGLTSPGGYVMDSDPGLYKNVLVLDFKSLYPSIIRTFKVDPLGLIEGLAHPDDAIEGFRGARFHRKNHFLPDIITKLWTQRDIAKRDGDGVRSQAIKILMNSFYGVLGSGGCRFYDPRLASSITMRGHEILQTTRKWIEQEGYAVIYGDTDSIFVWLGDELDGKACQRIGKQLAEKMNAAWVEQLERVFGLDCQLELEFETHFSRFLMPTIRGSQEGSKKRYAGLMMKQDENSDESTTTLVFKGLESVRTDWTELAKSFQIELYQLVFNDQSPEALVKRTVDETRAGRHDDQLVYRKQLRRRLDQYVKNVPPHVRAARLADENNRKLGKQLRYQSKGWISYVMTLNGPEPVEYLTSPIDYQHYIDRQLKPVAEGILPVIGLDFEALVSAQAVLF